ncbi:MAG: hypothetical protein AB1486_03940 [Planctomycetota bacterium]
MVERKMRRMVVIVTLRGGAPGRTRRGEIRSTVTWRGVQASEVGFGCEVDWYVAALRDQREHDDQCYRSSVIVSFSETSPHLAEMTASSSYLAPVRRALPGSELIADG